MPTAQASATPRREVVSAHAPAVAVVSLLDLERLREAVLGEREPYYVLADLDYLIGRAREAARPL
jgi:hypothetical protein